MLESDRDEEAGVRNGWRKSTVIGESTDRRDGQRVGRSERTQTKDGALRKRFFFISESPLISDISSLPLYYCRVGELEALCLFVFISIILSSISFVLQTVSYLSPFLCFSSSLLPCIWCISFSLPISLHSLSAHGIVSSGSSSQPTN